MERIWRYGQSRFSFSSDWREMWGELTEAFNKLLRQTKTKPTHKLVTSLVQSITPHMQYSLHCARVHSGPRPAEYPGIAIKLRPDNTWWDYSRILISPKQRPLRDKTQQSEDTGVHGPSGIRTPKPSDRKAADSRLTPCGHLHVFTFSDYKRFNADLLLSCPLGDGNISVEICSLFCVTNENR